MSNYSQSEPAWSRRTCVALASSATTGVVLAAALAAGSAPAQDLQQKLDQTQGELSDVTQREGVLTSEISEASDELSRLRSEVAELRNKAAVLKTELAQKEAELAEAQARLDELRDRLEAAVEVLEDRLVAIYKSGEPDLLTVVLESNGFDDLLERTEYLRRLEDQDSSIVDRVRELRDEMRQTVDTVKAARDEIATRKQELERIMSELEERVAELASAQKRQRTALAQVREQKQDLEGDLSDISEQIAKQLGSSAPLPAGPIRGSGRMIWPVNGTVTSGFGPRAMHGGEFHEALDIAVAGGTPIRAAESGRVAIAGPNGGYGNYTCVDHGGGLSSCYAHQAEIMVSGGQQVAQGQVIGLVGCTGSCTGNHVHFEVRVNGQAVDPLGYL